MGRELRQLGESDVTFTSASSASEQKVKSCISPSDEQTSYALTPQFKAYS